MQYIGSMVGATLVCGLIFIIGYFLLKHSVDEKDDDGKVVGSILLILASVGFVLWVGLHTGFASFRQVEAGHIGVVYEFGAIKTQIPEGVNWIAPWRNVKTANIQVQRHLFENLESFSLETQDVFVKASLNIKVSPGTIQDLYRTVGPNWFKVLVEARVAQNFKDETVKYRSVDIAPNRETIRQSVRERLEKELSSYSIEVVDLLLDNIDFSSEFKASIEAKQIATQKALEEEQRVKVSQFQANQRIEQARGEGSAILAVAEKQAEANKKLSESLTPELIQYALIQKLGDNIEVILLPSDQPFILGEGILKSLNKD